MKTISTMMLITFAAAIVSAQEFYLSNSVTGGTHGPFEFRQGGRVVLSNQTFVIHKILTHEQRVIEKMKAIIIPEIEFRQADIHDVIEFITRAAHEVEEPTRAGTTTGLSAIYTRDPQPHATTNVADPFASLPGTNDFTVITLQARYISMYDAVEIVSRLAGLKWTVQGKAIVFEARKVQQAPPEYSRPAAVRP